MTILDWVKANAKDGANIAEAEELISKANPITSVKTKVDAIQFIKNNELFASALDSETSTRSETRLKNFKEKDLPGLLKDREEALRKELNPEETPEQKQIRELEEWKAAQIEASKVNDLKSALRAKAQEIGADPLKAERYAVHGEKAEEFLISDHEAFNAAVKAGLDTEIKTRFGGKMPKVDNPKDPAKVMSRNAFEQLSPAERADFAKSGGEITDTQ